MCLCKPEKRRITANIFKMNRKDFFRTLFGGAALAAGVKHMAKAPETNMVKGFVSFQDDPFERFTPGAFGDSVPIRKNILLNHDSGKSIGQILEVSHTSDGIGFTYVHDKLCPASNEENRSGNCPRRLSPSPAKTQSGRCARVNTTRRIIAH